jgi:hypothetical protein
MLVQSPAMAGFENTQSLSHLKARRWGAFLFRGHPLTATMKFRFCILALGYETMSQYLLVIASSRGERGNLIRHNGSS